MDSNPIIAGFYRAASGRTQWSAALAAAGVALACRGVRLIGFDAHTDRQIFSFAAEGAPKLDGVGLPLERLRHAPLLEWIAVRDGTAALVHRDPANRCLVALELTNGVPVIDPLSDRARQLCFHLAQAVAIYLDAREASSRAALGREMLERISAPVLVTDSARRVVARNKAAERVLAAGPALWVDDAGRLFARSPKSDIEIERAIGAVIGGKSNGTGHRSSSYCVVRLHDSGGARPAVVFVSGLRIDGLGGECADTDLAMLAIHDLSGERPMDAFALSGVFNLTPAEARVTIALAQGKSPKDVAASFGVSTHTVNSHVRAIQAKIGVKRTPELIAVVHSALPGAL